METEVRLIDADTGAPANSGGFQQHTDYAIEIVGFRWWMEYTRDPRINTAIYEFKVRRLPDAPLQGN